MGVNFNRGEERCPSRQKEKKEYKDEAINSK